jgi:phosphatidylserine/phosphatidylglycerophosphate/cardiolipin synthase-like enzyme
MYSLLRWVRRFFMLRKLFIFLSMLGAGGAYVGWPQVKDAIAQQSLSVPVSGKLQHAGAVTVGFSPGNAESLVVQVINSAKQGSTLDLAAYEFTSKPIAEAVRAAHQRGAVVRVLVDQERLAGKYNAGTYLANNRVPLKASNSRYKIFHHKFVIVDGRTVQTGSYNYTTAAAKSNAENVLVMWEAKEVASAYTKEFERLWMEGRNVTQNY